MLNESFADAMKSTIVRLSRMTKAATPPGDPGRPKAMSAVAKAATLAGNAYPRELDRVVTLRDGSVMRVRPIRADDELRLAELFARLSERTVYHRFFAAYRRLPATWYRDLANVDYHARLALVAEDVGAAAVRVRGVVRWEPGEAPGTVEIALVIEDAWQGRGLGATLLDALVDAARGRGIERFCADVLAENHRMLRLLRGRMEVRQSSFAEGVVHLCLAPKVVAVA
jgi:GNAT superfamily N-acetyltransferase